MEIIYPVFVLLAGLFLGSFATALAYRLPRGISMLKKTRSACPSCKHQLGITDLVPVFSWVFLKGKCRYCKAKISARYPVAEAATAALCLALYYMMGPTPAMLIALLAAPVLIAIIDIDLHFKIIPDSMNAAILGLGVVVRMLLPDTDVADILAGMLIYGLGSFLLRYVCMRIMKREPMGLGDVKFFTAVGAWFGMDVDRLALFLMLSGLMGVVLGIFWKKWAKDPEFPFGPALVVSFIVVLLSYNVRF